MGVYWGDMVLLFDGVTVEPSKLRYDLGLLTEEELAAALELQVSTLQAWRSSGQGPHFVKLGKSVFYRRSDVEVWATDNLYSPERVA